MTRSSFVAGAATIVVSTIVVVACSIVDTKPTVSSSPAILGEATSATTAATVTPHTPTPGTRSATTLVPPDDPGTRPIITIGDVAFATELALTAAEQSRGLSGREQMEPQTGMLFPMNSDAIAAFWMRGMLISLDFVWIGSDCTVSDLTEMVPPPEEPEQTSGLPIYSPAVPIRYVFEVNAGEVEEHGIEIGDRVRFTNLAFGSKCAP